MTETKAVGSGNTHTHQVDTTSLGSVADIKKKFEPKKALVDGRERHIQLLPVAKVRPWAYMDGRWQFQQPAPFRHGTISINLRRWEMSETTFGLDDLLKANEDFQRAARKFNNQCASSNWEVATKVQGMLTSAKKQMKNLSAEGDCVALVLETVEDVIGQHCHVASEKLELASAAGENFLQNILDSITKNVPISITPRRTTITTTAVERMTAVVTLLTQYWGAIMDGAPGNDKRNELILALDTLHKRVRDEGSDPGGRRNIVRVI
jgi:hypothetical protein